MILFFTKKKKEKAEKVKHPFDANFKIQKLVKNKVS